MAWLHVAAVARHAAILGLIPGSGRRRDVRFAAAGLARSHPALAAFADPEVTAVWEAAPRADLRERVARLWDSADLADRRCDGYVIGDLYQELSAEARKGRALCQTPRFVTELLLDLSWKHAARTWDSVRMIDPACGTGHILVESLIRAGGARRLLSESAFAAIHGCDIDPYAALMARYRLLAAACRWAGRQMTFRDLPRDLPVRVACADSLLSDDEPLLERGRYHVVVANPPYVTPKDAASRDAIRCRYRAVCSGKYALSVPFEVLMHELCVPGGWVARLTARSFMTREFGRPLIEDYFSRLDLRWVIDTSGAYIPGHGTPTVILVSRNQPPSAAKVHVVMGVRGEPAAPADPARGIVWTEIARAVREVGALDRLAESLPGAGLAAQRETPGQPSETTMSQGAA